MSEWKEYKLGDIANIQTGPFGSQLHKSDYKSTGIPCIMPCNITANLDICCSNIAYISEEDADRLCKHKTQKGDIIYSRRGDIEKCAYISEKESGWVCGTGCLKVCINSEKANSKFIAYQLSTPLLKSWIVGNAVGTTMLNLNTSILSECPISLPSLPTQQKIANILSSLDDKIEVNRRINEQLEELAGALFKSWFVDFEPFKDGEFVESELGMIPKGWKVGMLGDLCVTNKRTYGAKFANEIAYLDTGSVTKNQIEGFQILNPEVDKIPSRARRAVTEGDILFSSVRPNQKHYAFLFAPQTNMVASTGFIVITANWSGYRYFIYQYLIQEEIIDKLQAIAEQSVSTYPSINASDITNLKLVIPPMDIIGKFAGMNLAFMSEIDKNQQEIHHLTTLRDTLLPKLMSGEIDVNEVKI